MFWFESACMYEGTYFFKKTANDCALANLTGKLFIILLFIMTFYFSTESSLANARTKSIRSGSCEPVIE